MTIWMETVKFKRNMACEACRKPLARRASSSPVFDAIGNRIESFADEDRRADYVMICDCGARLEFRSPEDVDQYKEPGEGHATGRPVQRLT